MRPGILIGIHSQPMFISDLKQTYPLQESITISLYEKNEKSIIKLMCV